VMLTLRRISQFKKDYKRCLKRGCEIVKLHNVIELLANSKKLDVKYKDHSLLGEYRDCRECHIEPDWLLIYKLTENELVLIRTGTHTDLFE
jgi:mRNA interferase YafQ